MRIAFFTYSEWAFGAIHNALCKELYRLGIYANIIDWNKQYSQLEMDAFLELYDVFVTVPGNAVPCLLSYGVPYDRIIAIAHGRYDIQSGISHGNDFNAFKKYGGVSPDLQEYSRMLGIDREMGIAMNGIHFDYFYEKPQTKLTNIGYGGVLEYKNPLDQGKDIKRGYLIKQVSDRTGIPVNVVTPRSYMSMPSYYKNVSCVMVSSTEESCGLPLMEASAAGRLPLSTPVGVARDYPNGPCIVLPFDDTDYVERSFSVLSTLKGDSYQYHLNCVEAQDFARQNYDWSIRIWDWVKLLAY